MKVFGGQHRIKAIQEALRKDVSAQHGVRVYFALDRDQRLDVAVANNTAIAISNDLLDRMYEGHLGPNDRSIRILEFPDRIHRSFIGWALNPLMLLNSSMIVIVNPP
jgi:aromatic ring-cleaving dioxygenase